MNTYYNIIFNGNEAIKDGITSVENEYPENYWDILPIERLQEKPKPKDIFNTQGKQEEAKNPDFKKAEEKATKAIQKHSMFIAGEEYNHQVDEAFLLLGKARYYSHKYIQAKDAFGYILNHYPRSSEIVDAKIWTEKVNMRLKYYDLALKNLEKIKIDYPELPEEEQVHLNSIIAEAHVLNEDYIEAIVALDEAIAISKPNGTQGRLLYIKAQLFDKLNLVDSANVTYQKVIDLNRKSPRTYMIHAKLEQLKNIPQDTSSYTNLMFNYQELVENRENRPFLDFIYFDIAEYHNAMDSISVAVENYNKSLSKVPKDKYLYSRNYLRLAKIYFDKNKYKTAGQYYDSTLIHLDKEKREYRLIAKKRENLEDVIKYEAIAQEKDSILKLVQMNKEEQIAFFEDYIETLKEEAKSVFAKAKMAGNSQANMANSNSKAQDRLGANTTSMTARARGAGGNAPASFYFYDSNQAQRGLLAFKQTWGNIQLADDWKYGGSRFGEKQGEEGEEEEKDPFANDPMYQVDTYLVQIPTEQPVIDSLWIDRNFAYYQLGVIYKEKFKEYDLAKNKFEDLLESDPEKRLILPSIYNLYLIAEEQNLPSELEKWKRKILDDYPESEYAMLLLNPEKLKESENNPQNIYKRLYKAYENKQYEMVIAQADQNAKRLIGRPITPKFELLKAYAIAKVEGLEAYREALNYVALTYPQSDEGKFAQQKFNELRQITPPSFRPDTDEQKYKLVYYFDDQLEKEEFQNLLDDALLELELTYKVTQEVYTSTRQFIVIDGLSSLLGAQGLAEIFIKEQYLSKNFNYFAVSDENYNIIQIHKNLDEYLNKLNK
jgi:tetratricopeptide (TPR) repeat protein